MSAECAVDLKAQLEGKVNELKPFRELQAFRGPKTTESQSSSAREIPEVVFSGELLHGEGFEGINFGITCSWHFIWDDPWTLLEGNMCGQTQLASSNECFAPWNHPIDIHFAARSPLGWPKLILQVQELDEHGRSHLAGYGFCHLPMKPGLSELAVSCWRPTGSMRDEISAFFLGSTPKLMSHDIISNKAAWANRCRLVTIPTGKVVVNLCVMLRNFQGHIDFP